MMLDRVEGRRLVAQFPDAVAVFVIGDFNYWSTVRTPMGRRSDGFWEASLPEDAEVGRLAYWVLEPGHIGGQVRWNDRSAA